jgi:hypothetical protein
MSALFGHLQYETRLVIFFDILGWKSKVNAAGEDPERIAALAAVVNMLSVFRHALSPGQEGRFSSFSDNAVVSVPYSAEAIDHSLQSLAQTLLGLTMMGHYMRGAITVGRIYHSDSAVFGPALNRAAELEKSAKVPRILLDGACPELVGAVSSVVDTENGESFVDGIHAEYAERPLQNSSLQHTAAARFEQLQGVPLAMPFAVPIPKKLVLRALAERVAKELTGELPVDVREKLRWLHDRLIIRLNA